jgi:uncharacterized protein YjbJ (UPF0337 family)
MRSLQRCFSALQRTAHSVRGRTDIPPWSCYVFGCSISAILATSATSTQGERMNKNQVKGAIKDAAGKVQEKAGEVTGSTSQQVKGISKQVQGKAQKLVGEIQEAAKNPRKP